MKLLIIFSLILLTTFSKANFKKIQSNSQTVFEFMNKIQVREPTITSNTTDNNPADNLKSPYIVDLSSGNSNISDWFQISSHAFRNTQKYPLIKGEDGSIIEIKYSSEQQRLNEKWVTAMSEGGLTKSDFWFKIAGSYIYYFATKQDINVLGSILVKRVEDSKYQSKFSNQTQTCFHVWDASNDKYKLCALTIETKLKWFCSLQQFLKNNLNEKCYPVGLTKANVTIDAGAAVEIRNITQPVIIIPLPSSRCNENWNYVNLGADWECQCADGQEQSPINLPERDNTPLSSVRPMFQYTTVFAKNTESTIDGSIIAGENLKIMYDRNAIRIHHPNMGSIVTDDGGVFKAEEIIFHTPSEHTINGKVFDMEMQVIHYGVSKGDIAKQVVLSFLFSSKPGKYNKFIDKLDFYALPNPTDTFRDITSDFFIPHVFYSVDDDDVATMKSFSFYTYEGSLTTPPCTERTTHYVAADPILLSSTVIQLFKEALRQPDMMNSKGEYVESPDGEIKNNRKIQNTNNRMVTFYDHVKFNCPEYKIKKKNIKPKGHYEKMEITTTQYIYVNGKEPSGLGDSFVVTENDAKGIETAIPGDKNTLESADDENKIKSA